MTVSAPVADLAQTVVLRWVDAFNARDLDRMLRCLDPDVRFHPLRLSGAWGSFRGHEGVREWFWQLRRRYDHRLLITEVQRVGEHRVGLFGSVCLDADVAIAPFCGLHRVRAGRIVTAHHYLTDPEMIESLGLIP